MQDRPVAGRKPRSVATTFSMSCRLRRSNPAVVAAEDFSTTPSAYADDVSDSDLLHGLTPVTTGWAKDNTHDRSC